MTPSEYSGLVDPVHDWINRPASLIVLALVLFLAHLLLVGYSLDLISPYNFRGMWITIPDYDIGINDPDSAFTRIYYRLNGWDRQWFTISRPMVINATALPQRIIHIPATSPSSHSSQCWDMHLA